MTVKHETDKIYKLSSDTIRKYVSHNKDKSPHQVEDKRHRRASLPVEVRDDLAQTLVKRDLSSRGCHTKDLQKMIHEVVGKEMSKSRRKNTSKSVLKWGREQGILKDGKQKSCTHNHWSHKT